jgi:membrane protein implicated in regulation of membrane protease activity
VPTWLIWLIAAGVFAIAEVLSLDLILIMCAGAAVVTAGVAALGAPLTLQAAVFALVAVGLLFVVRPAAQRHMLSTPHTATGVQALVGKQAVVLRTVDAHDGLVKLHGEEWSARSFDPHQVLEAGRTVDVMEIKGATALVWGDP